MAPNRLAGDPQKGADENAHVVLIDETGVQLAPLRRTWAKRGCRPWLRQFAGTRQKLSAIAALTISPKTHRRNLYFQTLIDGTYNSARVVAFLRDLLKHLRGRIIVVWDNGSLHKGFAIRQLLKRHPRLTLEWLLVRVHDPEVSPRTTSLRTPRAIPISAA